VIGSKLGNGEIGVLNVASGELEAPLIGHSRTVTSLTFSATGEWLISSSADSAIRVWDMDSRHTTRVFKGHQSGVDSVSLISNEFRAISAGGDERILEWDLNATLPPFGEHLLDERVEQVVFSADSGSFYTINDKGSVSIWDTKTLEKQQSLSPDLGSFSSIILSPDGNHLIAGTGTGQLWVSDGGDLRLVADPNTESGRIIPVGFSADGKSLVAVESSNEVSLWNIKTWKMRPSTKTTRKIKFLNRNWRIYAIPKESDVLLYPSGAELVWWDLEQSKELDHKRVNSQFSGNIAVSPTEPLLASAARGDFIALWNWQTREPVDDPLRGPKAFHGVAFSPDGRRLVTGSRGKGAFMLWDASTRPIQEIVRFGSSSMDLTTVQFSPDGNTICGIDIEDNAYFFQAPSLDRINDLEAIQRQKEGMR
jgi:WD40 repeat protein